MFTLLEGEHSSYHPGEDEESHARVEPKKRFFKDTRDRIKEGRGHLGKEIRGLPTDSATSAAVREKGVMENEAIARIDRTAVDRNEVEDEALENLIDVFAALPQQTQEAVLSDLGALKAEGNKVSRELVGKRLEVIHHWVANLRQRGVEFPADKVAQQEIWSDQAEREPAPGEERDRGEAPVPEVEAPEETEAIRPRPHVSSRERAQASRAAGESTDTHSPRERVRRIPKGRETIRKLLLDAVVGANPTAPARFEQRPQG
ncbi:MAG: hypothetical protein HY397_01610 [Candidatus Doudnabacteria bacterium]|nr:hypothetical protein [Candidatus Doudnabacteria bacterium]